ncbi:MAG: hypothetical protein VYE22_38685 [Myxococcota bacterium]|nr:hypothetical protein [Myxococcota bacterium]
MTAAPIPRTPRLRRLAAGPVRGLDRLRWLWLRALGPLARPLVRRRELRVAVAGTSLVGLALLGAALLPMWVLALAPIVWGVPHVLGDVRYLWVRPGLHRRVGLTLAVAAPLLVLSFTSHAGWGFLAAGLAALLARGPVWKKALAGGAAAALTWVAWRHELWTAIAFAHAHNFIGVALWWSWRERAGRLHWLPLLAFVGGGALILSGALDPLVGWTGALQPRPGGLDVYYHLGTLAPGVSGMMAVRLVLLFCFAQSVHYAVWVRLVPEEDRQRETPRTFAASLRALRADFGGPALALCFAAALGLGVWAAWDVFAARTGYLRAVLFHGHLELAAAALLFVEGLGPRRATERAPA